MFHALTLPLSLPIAFPQLRWPINQASRLAANQLLRDYVHSCEAQGRVALVDLENAWDQNGKHSLAWWSHDYVHLSKAGYEDMAKKVYEVMQAFEVTDNPTLCPGDVIQQQQHRLRLRQ